MKNALYYIRKMLVSPAFMLLSSMIAVAGFLLGEDMLMPCMIVNAMLVALVLVFCEDLYAVFMPFMGVMVNGTQYFGKWTEILDYILWAVPVAVAFVFHFAVYRQRPEVGATGLGNFAAAIALIVGGTGILSFSDLTSAEGLYHTIMLSSGMFLLYVLLYSGIKRQQDHDVYEYFLWSLFFVGLASSSWVFSNLINHLLSDNSADLSVYLEFLIARNSVAPMLVMALPAPFYFAKRRGNYGVRAMFFLFGLVFFAATLFIGARTALIFGTAMFMVCLLYFAFGRKDKIFKTVCFAVMVMLGSVVLYLAKDVLQGIVEVRLKEGMLISQDEARFNLLLRSFEDFCRYPFFGIGMVSGQNVDLCSEVEGSITWYHIYFAQIWGSMGLVGMAAYLYRDLVRLRLCFYKPNAKTAAIALSALGMFLYSQTDPGEFIPIPFGIMVILAYALLDKHYEEMRSIDFSNRPSWEYFPKK